MNHESRPGQTARGEEQIDWQEDHLHLTASPYAPACAALHDPASMLGWALAYAKNEHRPVFPCYEMEVPAEDCARHRKCDGHGGKSPYTDHGHNDATTDPHQMADWWIRWPDALIGSPVPSHLICLDLDPRHGGTIEAVTKVFGELPETEFVMSGRGDRGAHLFYLRPAGFITTSILRKVCPGVDIKLDTGYTILPPSLHPDSGMPYQWGGQESTRRSPSPSGKWCNTKAGHSLPVPAAQPPGPGGHPAEGRGREGNRNNVTFWAFNRLVENNYPESAYKAVAGAAAHSGLSRSEITKTCNSARKAVA